jgi:hypothetical protein
MNKQSKLRHLLNGSDISQSTVFHASCYFCDKNKINIRVILGFSIFLQALPYETCKVF